MTTAKGGEDIMNNQNSGRKSGSGRGFASMPKSKVKELGSKGGKASHRNDNNKGVNSQTQQSRDSSADTWTTDEDDI